MTTAKKTASTRKASAPQGHEDVYAAYIAFQAEVANIQPDTETTILDDRGDEKKHRYGSLGPYLTEVRPLLSAAGIAMIEEPCREAGQVGVGIRLVHAASGSEIVFAPVVFPEGDTVWSRASAYTYARKVAVKIACNLTDEDDDGLDAEGAARAATRAERARTATRTEGRQADRPADKRPDRKKAPASKNATAAQAARIRKDLDKHGITGAARESLLRSRGAEQDPQTGLCDTATLPRETASDLIDELAARKVGKGAPDEAQE